MRRNIEKFKHNHFDILIIGGGITGAAIAWDASLRGYSVALLEKNDYGHATSMATSKLIHGGLRYLGNYDFSLVRESLKERRYICDIIPHLIRPLPFLFPIYKYTPISKWLLNAGLYFYDLLSFDKNLVKESSSRLKNHSWLSVKKTIKAESNLSQKDLLGSFLYYDIQNIYPERMHLDFILSANQRGAITSNYVEVKDFIFQQTLDPVNGENANNKKKVIGVIAKNLVNKKSDDIEIHAKVVINCSGPWTNTLLNKATVRKPNRVVLSKGIHLVMPRRQEDQAIFIETKDNHHILILPWLNYTLLGTTDTRYTDSPDKVHVSKKDAQNFLDLVNEYYPVKYKANEIIHAYSGLRSLITQNTNFENNPDNTYKYSRRHKIVDHKYEGVSGLISVIGGKYTTSRELAEQTVDQAQRNYELGNMECATKITPLASANYGVSLSKFKNLAYQENEGKFSKKLIDHLFDYYGIYYKKILAIIKQNKNMGELIGPSSIRVKAEIQYAIEEESALTLSDFLYRRCGWGNEGLKDITILKSITDTMGKILRWSAKRKEKEISSYLKKQEILL